MQCEVLDPGPGTKHPFVKWEPSLISVTIDNNYVFIKRWSSASALERSISGFLQPGKNRMQDDDGNNNVHDDDHDDRITLRQGPSAECCGGHECCWLSVSGF